MMKKNEIFEIMDYFQKTNLSYFSWEQSDNKIVMERKLEIMPAAQSCESMPKEIKIPQTGGCLDVHDLKEEKLIIAPLVGTFYTKPSPDAKPFVQVGQVVRKGDVVGIIEAMKLMNEIRAKEDGVVSRFLVEDGKLVEFQQGLIALEEKTNV